MKAFTLFIIILTTLSFAKSYTVLDNRFNTPVESVLVVRLADSSSVYTDSLGVFEFDKITPVQDIKKIEGNQKWVDASGRVVVKPDPLRMIAFEVSNSEVVEFNSFKKVGFDFNLTRSGYDSKSVSSVDSVIVLDKQVLGDSILYSRIYNDVYKRRLYAWKGFYDSVAVLDSIILHSIPFEPQSYRDSLNLIRDSIYNVENSSEGWIKANTSDSLFDSIWVINERELGYAVKGDSSYQCEKIISYSYSFLGNEINSLNSFCSGSPQSFTSMINLETRQEELGITNKIYEIKQTLYAQFIFSLGHFSNIGYEAFNSNLFSYSEVSSNLIGIILESHLMWREELSSCGNQNWNNRFHFENNELKNTITQPENCKWITE